MSVVEAIPTIDISGYGFGVGDDAATRFLEDGKADVMAREITQALETYGAVNITGHGVPDHVLSDLFEANKKFALCSEDEKEKYALDVSTIHGWLAPDTEKFKDVIVKYSESFATVGIPSEATNRWPNDLSPGFLPAYRQAYKDSLELGKRLMTLLGLGAGLDDVTYLRDTNFKKPHTMFTRVNYYRPVGNNENVDSSAQRFAEHADLCTATILYRTPGGGLQVKSPKTGAWLSVPFNPDSLVFQVGKALAYISNGRFPESIHRVIFPDNADRFKDRQSVAFFIAGPMDDVLKSLDVSKPVDPITFKHFWKMYFDNHTNTDKVDWKLN